MKMHRNSQKRFKFDHAIYFVTTNTKDKFAYFENKILCELFIEELKVCKKLKRFKLYGFCVLRDHVHLLIEPNKEFGISKVMKSLKENFSRDVNRIINKEYTDLEGDTSTCRFPIQRYIYDQIQKQNFNRFVFFPKFKWQKSFHDNYIRNDKDFENHLHYAVYYFTKHEGYPENYRYTSLNYSELIDN